MKFRLGTSSICDEVTLFPKLSNLSLLVETVDTLRRRGHAVIIVSSGAVGVGLKRLGFDKRPKKLAQVQVSQWKHILLKRYIYSIILYYVFYRVVI